MTTWLTVLIHYPYGQESAVERLVDVIETMALVVEFRRQMELDREERCGWLY